MDKHGFGRHLVEDKTKGISFMSSVVCVVTDGSLHVRTCSTSHNSAMVVGVGGYRVRGHVGGSNQCR